MRWLIWAVSIFILMAVGNGAVESAHFLPAVPVLAVIFSAGALFSADRSEKIFIVLFGGIMLDFLSPYPDGLLTLSFITAALMIQKTFSYYFKTEDGLKFVFPAVFFQTLLFYFFVFVFEHVLFKAKLLPATQGAFVFSPMLLWYVLVNLLFAYPVYRYYCFVLKLARKFPKNKEI
jgi:cell shape-determining protein MreD